MARTKPPGGSPRARSVVRRRRQLAMQLAAKGVTRGEATAEIIRRFRVPLRTADEDLARAWDALRERDQTAIEDLRAQARQRITSIADKAEQKKDLAAQLRAEQLLLDLDGLRAPQKLELTARRAPSADDDPATMSDAQLEEIVTVANAELARRREALALPVAPVVSIVGKSA